MRKIQTVLKHFLKSHWRDLIFSYLKSFKDQMFGRSLARVPGCACTLMVTLSRGVNHHHLSRQQDTWLHSPVASFPKTIPWHCSSYTDALPAVASTLKQVFAALDHFLSTGKGQLSVKTPHWATGKTPDPATEILPSHQPSSLSTRKTVPNSEVLPLKLFTLRWLNVNLLPWVLTVKILQLVLQCDGDALQVRRGCISQSC